MLGPSSSPLWVLCLQEPVAQLKAAWQECVHKAAWVVLVPLSSLLLLAVPWVDSTAHTTVLPGGRAPHCPIPAQGEDLRLQTVNPAWFAESQQDTGWGPGGCATQESRPY